MPSSQTITSFYTFVQNTKARASQVNNNFDVIRGHFIPIHASTQTSANNTYDLGSTEYRWRNLYANTVIKAADAGTTTAATGGFALGAKISASSFLTTTSSPVAGTTVTVTTVGRPVEYSFIPSVADGTHSYIGINGNTTTADIQWIVSYMRDGVTIATQIFEDVLGGSVARYRPPSDLFNIDFPAAGTYNYSINAVISSGSATGANFVRVKAYAQER